MANEPDVSFSGKLGGMQPPGKYCYPAPPGKTPHCRDIPYPFVPGRTSESNPGDLPDK